MAADAEPPPREWIGDRGNSLQEFELYATQSNFYMIGMDREGKSRRVLKIDRTEHSELTLCEDETTYSAKECRELLERIHEGNRSTGGLNFVTNCYGIVGFAKFLGPHYMLLITKRRPIGDICGHTVYAISESRIITILGSNVRASAWDLRKENRYKKLLCMVDLTKDFFFSYSFHVMCSLQKNFSASQTGEVAYRTMFVWNEYLTRGIRNKLKNTLWTVALVYGFFRQENIKLQATGKDFKLTLIARRSRHYAGTRFLKRGVNEKGNVANDVETEQIVFEDIPGEHPSQMSSVVQYRGSIPLFWSQETSKLNLKPDIVVQENDQNHEATMLHFENLVERYGNPIIILNLIKTHEKTPRESKLWVEYANVIESINKHLSEEDYLRFLHWDLSKYSKREATGALVFLGRVATCALESTGFFCCQLTQALKYKKDMYQLTNGEDRLGDRAVRSTQKTYNQGQMDTICNYNLIKSPMLQRGVLRTNCIDCLDRTNVAQFAYGLAALGHQLHVLGLIDESKIDLDDPLADELMNFYETMGDTLALQYTGSAAHNKIFSERRGHWKAVIESQEFLRTLQRYYSNAYMDATKQAAINIFLGQYQHQEGELDIWELGSGWLCDVKAQVNGHSDENSRTIAKRFISDDDVPCEFEISSGNKQNRINSAFLNSVPQGETCNGLSSSASEIYSCDSNVFLARNISMDGENVCLSSARIMHYTNKRTSSNFLNLSWLSSSGDASEEKTCKCHLIDSPVQESAENRTDGLAGAIVLHHRAQDGKSANIEACDDIGNTSEYFVRWVMSGGTFYH